MWLSSSLEANNLVNFVSIIKFQTEAVTNYWTIWGHLREEYIKLHPIQLICLPVCLWLSKILACKIYYICYFFPHLLRPWPALDTDRHNWSIIWCCFTYHIHWYTTMKDNRFLERFWILYHYKYCKNRFWLFFTKSRHLYVNCNFTYNFQRHSLNPL